MTVNPIHSQTIILGSGPAGLTAAIYAARANIETKIITGAELGGQIVLTNNVDNYPGFPDGINGYDLAELFKAQVEKFKVEINYKSAVQVYKKNQLYFIETDDQKLYSCEALIVACGCSKRLSNIKGEGELFGYGVSSCATCDGMFYKGKKVVVIGNGSTACKDAIFLTKHAEKIYLISNTKELTATEELKQETEENSKIEIFNDTEVKEIKGSKIEGVNAIILKNNKIIACEGVFISTGFKPNSELFSNFLELDSKGYIITKTDSTEAKNQSGIFVCGDIRSGAIHQLVTATGSACQAIIEANNFLRNKKTKHY